MKRILVGTAIALFALAPEMVWADCEYHNAAMASSAPSAKAELARAPAASKAPAPVVAKTSVAKQVKHHISILFYPVLTAMRQRR